MKNIARAAGFGCAVALLAAGAAHAQVDRSKQPPVAPAPAASFPAYDEFTLGNGLQVFLVKDSRPLVTFRMMVRGGQSADGDVPMLGEAMADLMTHGTKKWGSDQFADEIDFIGGSIGITTSDDFFDLVASGLKSQSDRVLELFADAVKNPAYPADEVEKYKQEQITGLRAQMAQPAFLASQGVDRVLFGDTPYGRMPTDKSLAKLTPEMLRKHHDTYFVPGNAIMVVVGDYSVSDIRAKLESSFGNWAKGTVPAFATPSFPRRGSGMRIVVIDRPASVQSNIRVIGGGPLFNEPIRPKTTILANILGGGSTGRLYMNLRETHSYTYGSYGGFDANLHVGRFVATADVRNAVTDSALAEILHEIDRIRKEDVTKAELERTVQSTEGTFLLSVADPNITAQRVLFIRQYGLPKNYYNTLLGTYRSVTQKELKELAARYLAPENLSVVVVGKASEIKPKLERFGKVEVWSTDQLGG